MSPPDVLHTASAKRSIVHDLGRSLIYFHKMLGGSFFLQKMFQRKRQYPVTISKTETKPHTATISYFARRRVPLILSFCVRGNIFLPSRTKFSLLYLNTTNRSLISRLRLSAIGIPAYLSVDDIPGSHSLTIIFSHRMARSVVHFDRSASASTMSSGVVTFRFS